MSFIVKVKIDSSMYPDLANEIDRTPPRQRAERLRSLAVLGAAMSKNGASVHAPSSPSYTPVGGRKKAGFRKMDMSGKKSAEESS